MNNGFAIPTNDGVQIHRRLASEAYRNDGKPNNPLNDVQREAIAAMLADKRITYKTIERCVLCGNTDFDVIAEKDQFGIPLETAVCNCCGLVFSLQQFAGQSAAVFYGEYYRKIYEGVSGPTLEHDYYKRLFEDGRVPKVPGFIGEDSKVLELGCGGGWNLLPYHKQGVAHVGYDYDGYMVRFGRDKYGLNLKEGGLEAAQADGVRADLVIMSHVLEHTEDPVEFMKGVGSILQKDGLVRITVPCIDCLAYFGGSGIGYSLGMALQNAHNYTFSERTLRMTLVLAGFEPVVLVRGFCLAKLSPQLETADVAALSAGGAAEVKQVLASSERWLGTKKRIANAVPQRFRRFLAYVNLLPRLPSLIRYTLVLNRSQVDR